MYFQIARLSKNFCLLDLEMCVNHGVAHGVQFAIYKLGITGHYEIHMKHTFDGTTHEENVKFLICPEQQTLFVDIAWKYPFQRAVDCINLWLSQVNVGVKDFKMTPKMIDGLVENFKVWEIKEYDGNIGEDYVTDETNYNPLNVYEMDLETSDEKRTSIWQYSNAVQFPPSVDMEYGKQLLKKLGGVYNVC